MHEFADMLEEKNKFLNLTRIAREDFDTLQSLDSLAIVQAISTPTAGSLLDVGTGAGVPGIILKIAFPQWNITLLDSTLKKLTFLDEVIKQLRLKSIRTLHGRAEEIGKDIQYRQQFDIVTARAVGPMPMLSECCLPLVRVGGKFIAYKGDAIDEELHNSEHGIQLLGGGRPMVTSLLLPGTDLPRKIICIEKIRATPPEFPRASAIIKAKPLITSAKE